jgi:hypothetical protein
VGTGGTLEQTGSSSSSSRNSSSSVGRMVSTPVLCNLEDVRAKPRAVADTSALSIWALLWWDR